MARRRLSVRPPQPRGTYAPTPVRRRSPPPAPKIAGSRGGSDLFLCLAPDPPPRDARRPRRRKVRDDGVVSARERRPGRRGRRRPGESRRSPESTPSGGRRTPVRGLGGLEGYPGNLRTQNLKQEAIHGGRPAPTRSWCPLAHAGAGDARWVVPVSPLRGVPRHWSGRGPTGSPTPPP